LNVSGRYRLSELSCVGVLLEPDSLAASHGQHVSELRTNGLAGALVNAGVIALRYDRVPGVE